MSMDVVFELLNELRNITHSSEIEANYEMDSVQVIPLRLLIKSENCFPLT